MKKIVSFTVVAFLFTKSFAQLGSGEGQHVGQNKQFDPVPSTPNVAAFEKYGNLPIDYNTGIPQIGVPIWKIDLKGFSWPINLSYHASGFKSEDIAPKTGLGWTLNASGVISQSTSAFAGGWMEWLYYLNLGMTQLYGDCYPNYPEDVAIADGIIDGSIKTEPVIYNISSSTIGGKFFAKNGAGWMLPAGDLKIVLTTIDSLPYFTVYDDAGNKYDFNASGSNWKVSDCQGRISGPPNWSWYLTKITTSKGEEITFTYDAENYSYDMPDLHIRKAVDDYQCSRCSSELSSEDYYCQDSLTAYEKRLKKIESSDGTLIWFSYSSRSDLYGSTKLDQIDVWYKANGDSSLRKRVNFNYSYFGTGSDQYGLQLKLNEVVLKGNTGDSLSTYKFTYDTNALPNKLDQSIVFDNSSFTSPAHYNISQAGIIKKIEYPTGGYSTFEYDSLPQFGILRIKQIKDFSNDNSLASFRKYNYNDSLLSTIQIAFTESEATYYFGEVGVGSCAPPNCTDHSPCGQANNWLLQCNRTIWKNTPVRNSLLDYTDQTPRYGHVTELYGGNGEGGKIEYYYSAPSSSRGVEDADYILFWPGYLARKEVYKKNGDGSYTIIQKTLNEYETDTCGNNIFTESSHPKEMRAWIKKVWMLRPEMHLSCCDGVTTYCFEKTYLAQDLRLASTPVYLKKTIQRDFSGSDSISVVQNYYYEDLYHLKPTRTETIDSKGDTIRITNKYAHDYAGTAVYDTMWAKNNIDPVIEATQKNLAMSQELSKTKTNYLLWQSNTLTEPVTIQKSTLGNSLETDFTIDDYNDKGKILQFTGRDSLPTSFIYDYQSQYPIAKVIKANNASIAYTSFEADGKGGWTYSGSTASDATSPTGGKCYNLSGGNITKSGLTSTTYVITYWSKSGAFSINGSSTPTRTGKTIGSWTYYEHEVTTTSITVSGSNYIDELRLYPKGALMTTYTYTPLLGMTSQSDATGKISYYEYDNFGRLKLIKDQDKNVIQVFDYKYQTTQN